MGFLNLEIAVPEGYTVALAKQGEGSAGAGWYATSPEGVITFLGATHSAAKRAALQLPGKWPDTEAHKKVTLAEANTRANEAYAALRAVVHTDDQARFDKLCGELRDAYTASAEARTRPAPALILVPNSGDLPVGLEIALSLKLERLSAFWRTAEGGARSFVVEVQFRAPNRDTPNETVVAHRESTMRVEALDPEQRAAIDMWISYAPQPGGAKPPSIVVLMIQEACGLVMEHEVGEHLRFNGQRVADPHATE